MSASTETLEASTMCNLLKIRATLPRRPLCLQKAEYWQIGELLLWVKCSRLHPPYIYYIAMSASSNALEASISAQRVAKESHIASWPSILVNTKIGKQVFLEALTVA